MDTYQLVEAVALRADLVMTLVQKQFDPGLDVEKVTGKGLRGELYQTFLNGNASSIWIDAPAREVTQWMSGADNLNSLIPSLRLHGRCIENPEILLSRPDELIFCPATYRAGDQEIKSSALSRGYWEDKKRSSSYFHNIWIITPDTLLKAEIIVPKRGRGSELKLVISSELPGSATPRAVDLLVEISQIPERMEEVLLNAKTGVESRGGSPAATPSR